MVNRMIGSSKRARTGSVIRSFLNVVRATLLHLTVVAACAVMFLGCSTLRHLQPTRERAVFPQLTPMSETELEDYLSRVPNLEPPLRASLVWIEESSDGTEAAMPEAERTRLLHQLASSLSAAPFSSVSVIPTTRRTQQGAVRTDDIEFLRSAAARFQSDVLIVLNTQSNDYDHHNLLALTYVALAPVFFAPAHDLAVYASVEACVLDVRTSIFLACSPGYGDARRRFVTRGGIEHRSRQLVVAAFEEAMSTLPARLRSNLAARMTRASQTAEMIELPASRDNGASR